MRFAGIARSVAAGTKKRVAPHPAPATVRSLGPGTIADVVGNCLLVFAFVPALAAIPGWLRAEAADPSLLRDPVVLAFTLVRGVRAVLGALYEGIVPGVLGGLIDGVLLCAWMRSRGRAPALPAGAILGAVAASLMVVIVAAAQALAGQPRVWGAAAVAFEIGSGLVCGTLATASLARR